MEVAFADATYYVALPMPNDDLRDIAIACSQEERRIVTCDAVLVEVFAYVCERGDDARERAVALVNALSSDRMTTVVPQTRRLFNDAVTLFSRRPDKGYSLTDCMSMIICRERRIKQVLTHDHHFEQEGFETLL